MKNKSLKLHKNVVVFCVSCKAYKDRVSACRDTWGKELTDKGVTVYYVVGDPEQKEKFNVQDDILYVKCPDSYGDLPEKTKLLAEYFTTNYFHMDYMFKCDDDTYINVDNFLQYDKQENDYIGCPVAENSASGGAGYFLNKKCASIVACSNLTTGAEDVLVGETLHAHNIKLTDDHEKFNGWTYEWGQSDTCDRGDMGDIVPEYNKIRHFVTNHLLRLPAEKMYEIHDVISVGKKSAEAREFIIKCSKKVFLTGGFGNRLNNILNYIDELDDVTFVWPIDGSCDASWEDLFCFPKINTIYNNFSHYNAATISNYSWSFNYEHDKHKLELAKKFIKSLVPSKQVAELMPWFVSKHTTGYHLRLLHPRTVTKKIINIPPMSFMATDSAEQRAHCPDTIQTKGSGGTWDRCSNIRDKQGVLTAIADWFSLFNCNKIIEIGLPFESLTDATHSTFIDAHRIAGCNVINNTKQYLDDTSIKGSPEKPLP